MVWPLRRSEMLRVRLLAAPESGLLAAPLLELPEDVGGPAERREVGEVERAERGGEHAHARRAATAQDAGGLGRSVDTHRAPIPFIRDTPHQPFRPQARNQLRHRRRAHLFGGGELADRHGTAEDDDGEDGGAGGGQAGRGVGSPQIAKHVDGGGMQPFRDIHDSC